ncbi:MAG: AAA family ATPase [Thermostichales cyanobacterium HHBFW_bins_127]
MLKLTANPGNFVANLTKIEEYPARGALFLAQSLELVLASQHICQLPGNIINPASHIKASLKCTPMYSSEVLKFTSAQKSALECICRFVADPRQRVFLLQGYAGTGKTFLIGSMARWLQQHHGQVQLLAPTGRAARVITDKTGLPGMTIHRCIYNLNKLLENTEDNSKFKFYFEIKKTAADDMNVIYIVDESSMISDVESDTEFIRFGSGRLLKDLLEFARIPADQQLPKVIFVGDPAQLPPVNMPTSPALDPQYLKSEFNLDPETYCLTEVVRQAKDSAILQTATRIRCNIEQSQFNELVIRPHENQIEPITVENLKKLWTDAYRSSELNTRPPLICVTHSNAAALRYNLIARSALFGGSGEQQVRKGDFLMVVANNQRTGLLNGDLITVLDADDNRERRCVRFGKNGEEQYELQFRGVEIAYEQSLTTYKIKCLILENVLFSELRDITPEDQRALYVDFKIRHPTLRPNSKEFTEALLQDPYFNALRVKFGYAATCHKAQGGEWPAAVVVFEHQRTDRDGLRWAYTAITRASHKLYVVNPPNKLPWTGITPCQLPEPAPEAETCPTSPSGEANSDVPFLDTFPSNPELMFLRHKHIAAFAAWNRAGIQVEEVKIVTGNWFVRYRLRQGEAFVKLHMTFSKKARFTIQVISADDDALAKQACAMLEAASHVPTDITFPEDKPILKRFYEEFIQPRSKQAGISVVSVQHINYRERYVFRTGGSEAKIDFIYNERGEFTTYQVIGNTSGSQIAKLILNHLSEA